MSRPVRCPRCRNLSRVGSDDLGRFVACPHCGREFVAEPDEPPVVRSARRDQVPETDAEPDFHHPDPPGQHGPSVALIGLALMSWGIPLGWLVAPALTGREPIFSFAAPVAVAAGLTGLGLGITAARGSAATKAKALVGLLLVGYFTAGFLYFLKREWAEAIRHHVGHSPGDWKPFRPPPGGYEVQLPGPTDEATSPLPGWDLKAFQVADKRWPLDLFVVAHGSAPDDLPDAEDKWFDKAKDAVVAGAGGELRANPVPVEVGVRENGKEVRYPGREYIVDLPAQTTRIVRVFRVKERAYYLAAQGPFWRPDTGDVLRFFRSFQVKGK